MESLYVCLFSNGMVKVGRSKTPGQRIRQHEDRVCVMGVTLTTHCVFPCVGSAFAAEGVLVQRCVKAASKRHKNEWFEGLDFTQVVLWAREIAEECEQVEEPIDDANPNFRAILSTLKAAGYTQTEIALACSCGQSSISDLATGVTQDPSYSVGAALIRMARAHSESA